MLCGNGREGVVADGATNRGVFRHAWTEREWHRVSSSWQGLSAHTALQAPYLTPSPVQLMYDSTSCKDLTLAVSRADSRSEGRAEAVGVGSTALLDPAPHTDGERRLHAGQRPQATSQH